MDQDLVAALLLVVGGAVVLVRSQHRRPDPRRRLRRLRGAPPPSGRGLRAAAAAGLAALAVPAVPVLVALGGAPPAVVLLVALAVLPTVVALGVELHAGLRRSGMPPRVPLTAPWQQRLAGRLAARVVAPLPAPPLRRRPPRVRSRPLPLTSAGSGRRLLVVPPGSEPVRVWELAETYLGSRARYRDVLALNAGRRSPGGALITEESRILAGWTLLVPRDATGPGLVDLPGDPRVHPMPPAFAPPAPPPDPDPAPAAGPEAPALEEPPAAAPEEPPAAAPEEPPAAAPEEPEDAEEPPVADGERAPLEHPPADLPWDLVHAQMLADGVRTALRFRRAQREHDRPFGAAVPPLDPAAAAVCAAVVLGADRSGARLLDRAVRALGDAPPVVRSARLTADAVEFALAAPQFQPPAPFVAGDAGHRWVLPLAAPETGGRGTGALPGLVSLGRDRSGWVLADLLAAGGPVAILGDPRAARLVALAVGMELATKRWSDDLRVTMVGFGLTAPTVDDRLHVADRLDDVLDDVVRRVLDGRADDGRPPVPEFLVLAEPPPAAPAELLHRLTAAGGRSGPGVLVVGAGRHDRWRFELDGRGVLHCRELGLAVGAQALSTATAAALGDLAAAESGSLPADVPAGAPGRVAWPDPPRPVDPAGTEVVVRLFGAPRLDGPQGPLEARPVTVELVALLALRGTATAQEVARAVFPFGITGAELRTELEVVAGVLATAPSGRPGLLEHEDGRLELTADVQADWHLFVELGRSGRGRAALELLAVDAPPPRAGDDDGYGWLPGTALGRSVPGIVADTAHEEAQRALASGRPDLAAVAASAGLRAVPLSRLLREDLDRALDALRPERPLRPVGA
jgi:hypothetical protein